MKRRDKGTKGLYDPSLEHDSCGVGFVVNLNGEKSHEMLQTGIKALVNLEHRGALGSDTKTGDGAGILIQIPDKFFRREASFDLPAFGEYATGMVFLPNSKKKAKRAQSRIEELAREEGINVLGWRDVPTNPDVLGAGSIHSMPIFSQIFISVDGLSDMELERKAFLFRKYVENQFKDSANTDEDIEVMGGMSPTHDGVYFPSLSARTFVYKGMLIASQLSEFYSELNDEAVETSLTLFHSRFSTNTFPSWPLAHPYRVLAHNGEINTVQGNQNWMNAREELLSSPLLGDDLKKAFPICTPGSSDTGRFDECLEMLYMGGYEMDEAVLMMIPEPWENHESMPDGERAFYKYHASLMEPWDGPASIAFTNGEVIGAVLDRNGLRPSRYWVTKDDMVIMASEVGVVDVAPGDIVEKGRLQPGKMFFIDTKEGRIVRDNEIMERLAKARPYSDWLEQEQIELADISSNQSNQGVQNDNKASQISSSELRTLQRTFGYTHEELKLLITPMVKDGVEALGSMGSDTPIAVLSNRQRLLFDYFQQLFAQVTNPPLDAIREKIVTATLGWLGSERNLLDPQAESARQVIIPHPVLKNEELSSIKEIGSVNKNFKAHTVPILYEVAEGEAGLRTAIDELCASVDAAVDSGANIIVCSDRNTSKTHAPIPSLLATGALHHHLIRNKKRTRIGLVIETGEAREIHHICLLLAYGATAINPYLVFDSISDLISEGRYGLESDNIADAQKNYIKACDKGILKVMSKMGISTVRSYIGSQIFEAIGLGDEIIGEFFTGTISRLGGIGLKELALECQKRHKLAYPENPTELAHRSLSAGGEYQWRREGEHHLFNPETVFKLQHSTRSGKYEIFKEYTQRINEQSENLTTLRGLFKFQKAKKPIPIDEVESVSEIVKRFATGAMSFGSISAEAHETLAIAMNRIGGKSNSGEGGEDPRRYIADANGDFRRSAIKQAASGRFGVTSEYLVQATDLQIKMAQGAKPGEGGQLPGYKVWPWIADTRFSIPGVGLISPPPHHDIYSIEDIAQLIHDLKNANPEARVHVKLVSELGVGTVAAGVSKAHADVVLISGHDGGTGAAVLTSIKHAGTPWELGLAETQQTLLLNGLRDRIVVQVDGQLKTGRDVMVAALLGGEEFGFATAPLVVMGCVMMRVCHLDTCPVGVATQNPELRKKFTGKAEFVVNFMEFIAQEVREILAELGLRSINEAVGRVDLLDVEPALDHWKAAGLDISPILYMPELNMDKERYCVTEQDHGLDKALDKELIKLCEPALTKGEKVHFEKPIRNTNRTVGTMLGNELTKRWGAAGLLDDTISIVFRGSAGQSFGAFLPKGITLKIFGDTNDYAAKGLSGGRIVIRPDEDANFASEQNVISGNVIAYGATSGEIFISGIVGERFCVRNSGVTAVVEGVGDHACEYMTGGRALILGETGRNFGAGMSGGIAYVLDQNKNFEKKVNKELLLIEPIDDEDTEWLFEKINQHLLETESAIAGRLLANWKTSQNDFVKVIPEDYKRVMEIIKSNESNENGENDEVLVELMMKAAHD